MTPWYDLTPKRDLAKRPGLTPRLTGTAAGVIAILGFAILTRSKGANLPSSWWWRIFLVPVLCWPVLMLRSRSRFRLAAGTIVSALYLFPNALFSTKVAFPARFALVALWIGATAATIALLDGEVRDDHRSLASTREPTASNNGSRRRLLASGSALAGLLVITYLIPMRLPQRQAPNAEETTPTGDRPRRTDPWSRDGPTTPAEGFQSWHTNLEPQQRPQGTNRVLATLSGSHVLRVRGMVFDQYRNGVWTSSVAPSKSDSLASSNIIYLPNAPTLAAPRDVATETWELTIKQPRIQLLLMPHEPVSVQADSGRRWDVPLSAYTTRLGSVLFLPELPVGTTIGITSQRWLGTADDLAAVTAGEKRPADPVDYQDSSALDGTQAAGVVVSANSRTQQRRAHYSRAGRQHRDLPA